VIEEGIPKSVSDFIATSIGSLEQLEILLLLRDAQGEERSVADIYSQIQSSPASVHQRLISLKEAGLLVESAERFRFEPKAAELRALVDLLASNYQARRVRVIEAIYSKKSDAMQSFADAFRIKRKE
jgi:DNA-binding transcriptional ArsR family regulator